MIHTVGRAVNGYRLVYNQRESKIMPQLRFIDDSGSLKTLSLGTQPLLIGRVNSCDITFIDDMVSREHTRIDREPDGRYRVRDLGSRNKTHVNGQQTNETLLTYGDVIRVGDHIIEYIDASENRDKLSTDFLTPDSRDPADCDWVKSKAPLTLSVAQVEQLSGLSAQWGLSSRSEDIAENCLSQLIVELQAERGFIAVRGEEKHTISPIAARGLTKSLTGSLTPVSQTFALAPILQKVGGRYPKSARKIDDRAGYASVANGGTHYVSRFSDRHSVRGQTFKQTAVHFCGVAVHVGCR